MTAHQIALIPGDGFGVDVTDATMQVLDSAAARFDFALRTTRFDRSCEPYRATGRMMPLDGTEILRGFDAIYLGAVG